MSSLVVLNREKKQHETLRGRAGQAYADLKSPWNSESEAVCKELDSDPKAGLSREEIALRLELFGPNVLKAERKTPWYKRLFAQFTSPVVVTLIIATVISAFLGERTDAIAIISIVIVNAIVGYLQEAKAEQAVEALKRLSAPKARVLRGGTVAEVEARDVCPGDILVLEAGDFISADARLIVASQFSTDEAVLTGESLSVIKSTKVLPKEIPLADRLNMLFAGTAAAAGSARAVVVETGMNTEIGRIAGMIESAEESRTPLQERLEQVSSKLLIFCIAVVIVVAVFGLLRKDPWIDVLMSAISLAVAAIPEGLPAIVTLALALAVRRMSKRNAIVRHLPAVETLGSTDVICTDKTGTLTTGKMRVRDVAVGAKPAVATDSASLDGNDEFMSLVTSAVLCSNASLGDNGQGIGDPTEVALLQLAKEHRVNLAALNNRNPRIAEWSFESVRKRMSVAVSNGDKAVLHVKGAPESVLSRCALSEADKRAVLAQIEALSSQGRRLLAVASRTLGESASDLPAKQLTADTVESGLTFQGLVAMADPPRVESIDAIRKCHGAGIKVVMITGDHPITAKAIAAELGIIMPGKFDQVLAGPGLDALSDEELVKRVEQVAVYARVSPEHKLRIVKAWKAQGSVVAMTGDGVNDAPALKEASIGVSMGKGGTEVARQASSMILADDNFASIVSAVEEGRAIFGNIRRSIQYLLSGNLSEILIMLGAALLGWPVPLAPIHLLWINLVTDGLPALALAAEPVPEGLLTSTGRPSPASFFDRHFYREMIFVGVTVTVLALGVYDYSMRFEDEITARTHVFSFLVFAELFRSFANRSETKTIFQLGPASNLYHVGAVSVPIVFQLLLHHTTWFEEVFKVRTISWTECLVMLGLTLVPVSLLEIRKYFRYGAV